MDDLAERIPTPDLPVQERIEREECNARSREAMARLKPDERTAPLLKADGYSYREIGEREGWTYTKVCGRFGAPVPARRPAWTSASPRRRSSPA